MEPTKKPNFWERTKKEYKEVRADLCSLVHDKARKKFLLKEFIFWIIALIISGIGFFGGLALLNFLGKHIIKIIKHILSKFG